MVGSDTVMVAPVPLKLVNPVRQARDQLAQISPFERAEGFLLDTTEAFGMFVIAAGGIAALLYLLVPHALLPGPVVYLLGVLVFVGASAPFLLAFAVLLVLFGDFAFRRYLAWHVYRSVTLGSMSVGTVVDALKAPRSLPRGAARFGLPLSRVRYAEYASWRVARKVLREARAAGLSSPLENALLDFQMPWRVPAKEALGLLASSDESDALEALSRCYQLRQAHAPLAFRSAEIRNDWSADDLLRFLLPEGQPADPEAFALAVKLAAEWAKDVTGLFELVESVVGS